MITSDLTFFPCGVHLEIESLRLELYLDPLSIDLYVMWLIHMEAT